MKPKSIRTKLGLLLVIIFYLSNNISHAIDNAKSDGMLRNSIVNEHLTEHFERNFAVLRTVARNPMTLHYIQAEPEKRDKVTEQTLRQANAVFKDENNMIVTDGSAQQLARSDN